MKVGFLPLLAILFIGLKLGGVIAWSWLWVLSPLWIPILIAMFLWVMLLVLCIAGEDVTGGKKKPRR